MRLPLISDRDVLLYFVRMWRATGLPLSYRNAVYLKCRFGTTSGSRQTLLTGEAVRGAAVKLADAMKEVDNDLEKLNGKNYFYEYYEPTDKLGANVPYPKSHIAYGFADMLLSLIKKEK